MSVWCVCVLFCVKCGRLLEPRKSIGALCLECYAEVNRLLCVPEKVEFEYCKYCGSIRWGHQWISGGEVSEASLVFTRKFLENRIKPCLNTVRRYELVDLHPLTVPSWRTVYSATYSVLIEGVDELVRQEYSLEVYARPTVCPSCKNARGGDYNVLLQIRGIPPTELARTLRRLLDSSVQIASSIVDVVEHSNGVDFLLLDRGSATKIIRELKKYYDVNIKITSEDVGVTSRGRLRRRTVISLSLLSSRTRKQSRAKS